MLAIAWYKYNKSNWLINHVKNKFSKNQNSADHLERVKGNNSVSKYVDIDDTETIYDDHVIPLKVVRDWNTILNAWHMKYNLKILLTLKDNLVYFLESIRNHCCN